MKRFLLLVSVLLLFVSAAIVLTQEQPPTLEITGINASGLPVTVITATVTDNASRTVPDLTTADFVLSGALAEVGTVVSVETTTDDSIPFGVVLVIDISSSMAGSPIDKAREAALQFVASVAPTDPIAVIAFNNNARLVQDFTSDRVLLNAAIEGLFVTGQTGLYEAALAGVDQAVLSPVENRAVIILSDGAEFGGSSNVGPEAALEKAVLEGVSVYTIGLGFGTDRTYLQRLADNTNALFLEAPTPEQLSGVYQRLADLFRSQYIITLNADVPLDGTEYAFSLLANTPKGTTNTVEGVVRAPVPVPVVRLNAPDAPIDTETRIAPEIIADDGVTAVTATLDGTALDVVNNGITLDPLVLAPGDYTLEFSVTDATGDLTTASDSLTIAAIPSSIEIAFEPDTTVLETSATVTVSGEGQTALTSVSYAIDGVTQDIADAASNFAVLLNPLEIAAGEQVLTVTATNAGGAQTTQEITLLIAPIAPTVSVSGIADGDEITDITTINAETITQAGADVASTTIEIGDQTITDFPFAIDPADFPPGALDIIITVVDSNGQTDTQTFTVVIPDQGLQVEAPAPDADVTEATDVPLTITSQTPIVSATLTVNGETTDLPVNADGTLSAITIDPSSITENGDYVATLTLTNASGATTTVEIPFTVSGILPTATPTLPTTATPLPATATAVPATATAVPLTDVPTDVPATDIPTDVPTTETTAPTLVAVVPTDTAAPSATPTNEPSPSPTKPTATATLNANATATAQAEADANATSTTIAGATGVAVNNANATATSLSREVTRAAQMTQTQQSLATRTANAQLTSTVAVQITQTSVSRVATQGASIVATRAMANANSTATREAMTTATALSDARATVGANVTGTAAADASLQAAITPEATTETTAESTDVPATPTPEVTAIVASATAAETSATAAPATQTPIAGLQTTGDQTPPAQPDILPYIICGGAALLLALLLYLLSRGRRE